MSHGPMAQGAVQSAEMILGQQEQVSILSITVDSTIQSALQEIKETITKYPDDQWVILTDILGGTPFNASYRFLEERPDIFIIAGFNLPILLETFMMAESSPEAIKEYIISHKESVISLVEYATPSEEEEEFDL